MEERGDGSGGPAGQPGSFTCFDLDDSRGYVFDGILPYNSRISAGNHGLLSWGEVRRISMDWFWFIFEV